MTTVETPLLVEDTRAYPQGEIFLLQREGDDFQALVYNTTGLNRCPAEVFNAIDIEQVARDTGSDLVWKNPRRYWMMDALTINLVGEPCQFGDLMFNFVAKMQMPAGFDPQRDQSAMAYHPMQIHRVSIYEFRAGRQVFLLRSPEGVTWVMQTFTDHIDPDLTEATLADLGARLTLAEGWEFKSTTLDRDLVIDTKGLANIASDDLANMYQGCIDGVNNFDPWE